MALGMSGQCSAPAGKVLVTVLTRALSLLTYLMAVFSPEHWHLNQLDGGVFTRALSLISTWWWCFHQCIVIDINLMAMFSPEHCHWYKFDGGGFTRALSLISTWWQCFHQSIVIDINLMTVFSPEHCHWYQLDGGVFTRALSLISTWRCFH